MSLPSPTSPTKPVREFWFKVWAWERWHRFKLSSTEAWTCLLGVPPLLLTTHSIHISDLKVFSLERINILWEGCFVIVDQETRYQAHLCLHFVLGRWYPLGNPHKHMSLAHVQSMCESMGYSSWILGYIRVIILHIFSAQRSWSVG